MLEQQLDKSSNSPTNKSSNSPPEKRRTPQIHDLPSLSCRPFKSPLRMASRCETFKASCACAGQPSSCESKNRRRFSSDWSRLLQEPGRILGSPPGPGKKRLRVLAAGFLGHSPQTHGRLKRTADRVGLGGFEVAQTGQRRTAEGYDNCH